MIDLLEQVENDPRFNAAIKSLHSTTDSIPSIKIVPKTDQRTNRPSDSQTNRRYNITTNTPSDTNTNRLSDSPANTPSNTTTNRLSDSLTNAPSDATTNRLSDTISDYQIIPLDVLTLSNLQAQILEFLINKILDGPTCYAEITRCTNIKLNSVRDAISRLIKKGFMQKPVTIRTATFQGFSYVLNKSLCDHFISLGGLSYYQSRYQTNNPATIITNRPSDSDTVGQSYSHTPHSSSSYINSLTTTLEPPDHDVKLSVNGNFVLCGPEMSYWVDVGLQERQVQKWCSDFDVSVTDLRQQLSWARWDLVVNGKEKEIKKSVISWVFGIFSKTACCYPRPENYQTPMEVRAAQMKIQQEKEEQARQQIKNIEMEEAFQKMLADPDGEQYQKVWSSLSKIEQGYAKGGAAFEPVMKAKFKDMLQKNN